MTDYILQCKYENCIYDACHEKIDPFEDQNIVNFWVFRLFKICSIFTITVYTSPYSEP